MPGLAGNPHHNYDRHLRLAIEETFGVVDPTTPDWNVIPILGDGYKLFAESPRYFPEVNFGGWRRQVGIHYMHDLAGPHTMLAWPAATCYMLSAALDRDADGDLYSYTHDYYTPTDPRRSLGCVVETLAIRVMGSGDSDVQIETAWRGQRQAKNDALAVTDYDYSGLAAVPWMFRDAVLRIEAAVVIDIAEFTLNVNNNVEAGPNTGGYTAFLEAGRRFISLDLNKCNLDDDKNALIRAGGTMSFEAIFTHPLGHILQIQLPYLAVETSDESVSETEVSKETPLLQALSTEGNDIIWGCDLVDDGTTTIAPLTSTTEAPTTSTTTAAE